MNRVVLWATMCLPLWAQAPKNLTYEVVSIKPHADGDMRMMINGGARDGGRLNMTGVPVSVILQLAYASGDGSRVMDINNSVVGLPGWASADRYDIDARPPAGLVPTAEQSREMMRALLEERFALKAHKETKDGPVYALVVGKGGPKLTLAADQSPLQVPGAKPAAGREAGGPAVPPPPPPPPPPPRPGAAGGNRMPPLASMPRGLMMNSPGMLRGTALTMERFAGLLSSQAGRRVVDKTGLTGLYDVELKFMPNQPMQLPPGAALPPGITLPEPDPNSPSIFTAVQEQLGLKLESATAPLESIVVEHIEKPAAN